MPEINGAAGGCSGGDGPPESIAPEHAAFVTGFPCTQFGCRGTVRRDRRFARPAVTCSACEQLYYFVRDE